MPRHASVLLLAALLVGCGHSHQTPASTPAELVPSRAQASTWASRWCGLIPGTTRADVQTTMGKPTSTFPDQDSWDGFGYMFTAFYDENNLVRQLDYNETQLTAAQQAGLPCESTRP